MEVIFATSALFASAEFQALQAVRERFLTEELIGQYRGWVREAVSREETEHSSPFHTVLCIVDSHASPSTK